MASNNGLDDLKGKLFIISGPSGVGKGTLISELKRIFPQFVYPISRTTRQIRPGEKEGEVYHFISKEEFERSIAQEDFLEWARIHNGNYYGTLKKPIIEALREGKIVFREVDVQGFHSIKKVIPADKMVTIFLKAESTGKLLERIAKRGKLPEDEIKFRMESAKREMADAGQFDYQVWSLDGQIDKCVQDVRKIIEDEAAKANLNLVYS